MAKDLKSIEKENYIRLQYLVIDYGCDFLRNLFTSNWILLGFQPWEKNVTGAARVFKNGVGAVLYDKARRIQKDLIDQGKLEAWDVQLLISALKALNSQLPRSKHVDPSQLDGINEVRNLISHSEGQRMEDSKFLKNWEKVTGHFVSLGMEEEDLLLLRSEPKIEQDQGKPEISYPAAENVKKVLEEGAHCAENGELKKALTLYTEAIFKRGVSNQELAQLYKQRSKANLLLKNFEDAGKDAHSCITLHPHWADGYKAMGLSHEKMGRFEQALANFEMGLLYAPDCYELLESIEAMKHRIKKLDRKEYMEPSLCTNPYEEVREKDSQRMKLIKKMFKNQGLEAQINKMMPEEVVWCYEAGKFEHGEEGYPQDYEQAAKLYAKAARKNSAEGLYHLGLLLLEGKGVKRDVFEARRKFLQAATLPPEIGLNGDKHRNPGVGESLHALGLAAHEGWGTAVNYKEAAAWYEKAIECRYPYSAINLAMLYEQGKGVPKNFEKAVQLLEPVAVNGVLRAMESLFRVYYTRVQHEAFNAKHVTDGWAWYNCARQMGSLVDVPLSLFPAEVQGYEVVPDKWLAFVKTRVEQGSYAYLLEEKDGLNNIVPNQMANLNLDSDDPKKELRLWHRRCLSKFRTMMKRCPNTKMEPGEGNILPNLDFDLCGMQKIFLKDLKETKEDDKLYEKKCLKLWVIEDPVETNGGGKVVIVQDEKGDAERVTVYQYPANKNFMEDYAFGTCFNLISPYYRKANDGNFCIRVDNPNTMMANSHLSDASRCRYCFKEDGRVFCRKCRRVYHCSRPCFEKDKTELEHELVCFKKL